MWDLILSVPDHCLYCFYFGLDKQNRPLHKFDT